MTAQTIHWDESLVARVVSIVKTYGLLYDLFRLHGFIGGHNIWKAHQRDKPDTPRSFY